LWHISSLGESVSGVIRRRGGYLRKTGAVGVLVVMLVLGYELHTGEIGPEQLLGR
jgi:hypothetical protein